MNSWLTKKATSSSLEMNTRLQVEHPVTECTTGLDLVELQLQVASGESTSGRSAGDPWAFDRSAPVRRGPRQELAAAERNRPPHRVAPVTRKNSVFCREQGVRLDSGVVDGSVVGVHYDPMLAKVISYAPTRTAAARLLASTLARTRIHGLRTNRDLARQRPGPPRLHCRRHRHCLLRDSRPREAVYALGRYRRRKTLGVGGGTCRCRAQPGVGPASSAACPAGGATSRRSRQSKS